MTTSNEQIQQIFNSFDKDKNGTIELSELKDVAEALGQKLSETQVQEIVQKLDTDGDGKISLPQFKFWWNNGLRGKLGQLVYLKAKAMKMTKAFMGEFEKAGINLKQFDKDTEIDVINVNIDCGDAVEGSMKLDASIYHKGDRFKDQVKALKEKGVKQFNQNSGNFLAILPSDDPQKAKQEILKLLKVLGSSGQLPFLEGQGADNPYLDIKLDPLEKALVFHIQLKESLMEIVSGPTEQFDAIDSLFDENFYIFLKICFETNFSINDLLEKDNIIETLLKGFDLNISGEAPNSVMKKYRQLVQKSGKSGNGSMSFLMSLLMKNVYLNLKFKNPSSVQKFYSKIGIKDILSQAPNLADLLEQISLVPEVQQIKFGDEDPRHFVYEFIKCLKSNINSGVELYFQRKQTLVHIQTRFPDAYKIFNIVFNQC